MECPISLDGEDIRNEKVKLVRSISPISMDDIVTGQYRGATTPDGKEKPGAPPRLSFTPECTRLEPCCEIKAC